MPNKENEYHEIKDVFITEELPVLIRKYSETALSLKIAIQNGTMKVDGKKIKFDVMTSPNGMTIYIWIGDEKFSIDLGDIIQDLTFKYILP